jgi:hypothetical protein
MSGRGRRRSHINTSTWVSPRFRGTSIALIADDHHQVVLEGNDALGQPTGRAPGVGSAGVPLATSSMSPNGHSSVRAHWAIAERNWEVASPARDGSPAVGRLPNGMAVAALPSSSAQAIHRCADSPAANPRTPRLIRKHTVRIGKPCRRTGRSGPGGIAG